MLHGQVAIVTGATRGIGRAVLDRFAEEGATVIGLYQSQEALAKDASAYWAERGRRVRFYRGGISDEAFVSQTFRHVWEEYGRLDIVVNNAGVTRDTLLFEMTDEAWKLPVAVNWGGTLLCCHAALPYMERQKSGCIINMVSVTAVFGREAQCNYGASKGAIVGLTRLLGRRYAPKGIRINALAPGMIKTEMLDSVPQEKLDNFVHHTQCKRLGQAREVADAALFLASHLSTYVSGTVLKVDGGVIR